MLEDRGWWYSFEVVFTLRVKTPHAEREEYDRKRKPKVVLTLRVRDSSRGA